MDVKNLKIGSQLKIGFASLLVFVILLGIVSYLQSNQIHRQIETLYDHPLKVRRAIGALEADILSMRLGTRNIILAKTEQEKQDAVQSIELSAADALKQFNVLEERYLGQRSDVDEAYKSFIGWKTLHEETTRQALSGDFEKVKQSISYGGAEGIYRDQMMAKIKEIDNFAVKKADSLHASSIELKSSLNIRLALLVSVILFLSLIIHIILLHNIRKPLYELTIAAKKFHNGDMSARASYESTNEFGVLTDSFNAMVESVQLNSDLDEKTADIASLMLSEYDAKKFFQTSLNALAVHTGSQMAAIYLLSGDKKTFEHFESIGIDNNARQSFAADAFEGEFGAALSSREVEVIKDIPKDTRFVFHTVSGKFIPREIVTIPILADNEVIAVISMSTISMYSKQSIQLINNIFATLCARVEGILAYHKIKEFSEKLTNQNAELEAQKSEMEAQSAELIEQNAELEIQKNQLDEASRLKTNFLSNMSHELRTPLNSIIALSGVLNRRLAKQIDEEEYSYLDVIERNGKHLLSLINDILDISRIEAGHEEIDITKFSINNLISEVISMIHPQAEQNNIELVYAETDANIFILSDIDKYRHILQNLISNAVKFTEEGKVLVTSRESNDNIIINVSDTGIGISEEHLPHIFDEFRQADSSTSRKFGGTGLGLAIVKKYANLLGGRIDVKSSLGKGSEFTLTMPLIYKSENRINDDKKTFELKYAVKQTAYKPDYDSYIKTILLVEDSEPAIIQLKDILEESGCRILVARDGGEALRIIANTIPDAMILDLMMPGVDGFEVLRTIREAELTAQIPVLILTAKHITKEELRFLKRNNIHQLIQKGDVNRNDLLRAVAAMIFPETAQTDKPKREIQKISGKPVVLVVEDNPDNLLTVKAILSDNYTVIEAVDGNDGVEKAKKHEPNLILMDIALPVMHGVESFLMIRKLPKLQHIPVIALTASAMTGDRESILAFGFDAYIAKPIDEHVFFKTINEVLYGK